MFNKGEKNMGILAIVALLIVGYFAFSAVWGIAEFIIAVLIWALIGFLAGQLTRGQGFGLIGNVLVGLVGGMVGGFVFRVIGIGGLGNLPLVGGILTGVIGAVITVMLVNLVNGNRGKNKITA